MRITRHQLHDLINEEISNVLLMSENRRLLETRGDYVGELYNMEAADLLDFAESYAKLGTAVQEQLHDLMASGEDADVNPNAVRLIRDRLGGLNAEIDEVLTAWEATYGGGPPQV